MIERSMKLCYYLNDKVKQDYNDAVDVIVSCLRKVVSAYGDERDVAKPGLWNIDHVIFMCEQEVPQLISWQQFYKLEFCDRIRFPSGLNLHHIFESYLTDKERRFYELLQQVVQVLDSERCHSFANQNIIQVQDLIYFVNDLFDAFLHLYEVFNQNAIESVKMWLQEVGLTDLRTVENSDKFRLLVSMDHAHDYPIISVSLITETNTKTFQPDSRFLGWCFNPIPEQIYGADESDSNVYLDYCGNLEQCIVRILQNAFFLEKMRCLQSYYNIVYHVANVESMLHSDTYNEVFIDGRAKPIAVFCKLTKDFNQDVEKDCSIARKIGREKGKPIVFLDERGDKPRITVEQPLKEYGRRVHEI